MGDRISIPTSDSAADQSTSRIGSWMLLAVGLSILIGVFAVTGDSKPAATDAAQEEEIAPPPQVDTPERPPLEAFTFPSTGVVTAIDEVDGALVAAVAGDVWGSSLWRLDDASGTWTLTHPLPGVTVLDVVAHSDGIAVVGFDRFDRSPVLSVGPVADPRRVPIELETGEVPYQVDLVSGSLYVLTRFDGGASRAAYRVDADGGTHRLRAEAGDVVVADVLSSGGRILAVGSADGGPAMWNVGADGELEAVDLDIDLDGGRIAAAGARSTGEILGLVVGDFAGGLPSTAVYRLEPPFEQLDEPIPGVWDRFVPAGVDLLALPADLVALPASGVTTYRTDSGVAWVAGRARFTGPGGGGPGEGTIVISDAVSRGTGALVVVGASSGQTSSPVVASEAPVGDSSSIPAARWRSVGGIEPGREIVHLGGIHVAVFEEVVTVRDDFDARWRQPVFADEPAVGGLVDVVELDFGYLLFATQPYSALWYSADGSAWQLVARDVIRIAGSGSSAVAVVGARDAPDLLRIDSTGLVDIVTDVDPLVIVADRLGRVDSVGYAAGPVDGSVYRSVDGVEWSVLELDGEVEAIRFGTTSLAARTSAGWLRYDPAEETATPIRSPLGGEPLPPLQVRGTDGGLLFGDRALAWVSSDFRQWTEVSLGAWRGADGVFIDLWAVEDEVVALVGDDSRRTFVVLER